MSRICNVCFNKRRIASGETCPGCFGMGLSCCDGGFGQRDSDAIEAIAATIGAVATGLSVGFSPQHSTNPFRAEQDEE